MTTDPGSGGPATGDPGADPGATQASSRLQSMLAQAVEGQRDEQEQLVGALADVRSQLLRLGQEIAQLRATAPAEASDSSSLNNVTVELREAVRFLSERLDGVARMVAQRGEELADFRTALTALDAHVRSQAETIGVLSQGLQALPSYGERVSSLQDHVDGLSARLGEVHSAVSQPVDTTGLESRLSAIEASIAPLGQHLAQSRQADADHSATLADQSATLAEQAQAMTAHQASMDALHERVESLAAGTQAALAMPPAVDDSAIQAVDARLTSMAADLTALGAEVAGLVEAGEREAARAPVADTDRLTTALRESEARTRAHVDDAVLALAEILLRRRGPGVAMPSDPSLPDTSRDVDVDSGEAETQIETEALESTVAPAVDDTGTASEWWKQDDEPDEEPDDEPGGPNSMVDFSAVEIADEESTQAQTDGEPADDAPAPVAPASAGWSPEKPPERPGVDPNTGTVIPERRRRWFSR